MKARLRKTNHLFTYSTLNPSGSAHHTPIPEVYKSTGPVKVSISENDNGLSISADDQKEVEGVVAPVAGAPPADYKIKYEKDAPNPPDLSGSFSDAKAATRPPDFFFNSSDAKNYFGSQGTMIRYRQLKFYMQAMTTAFKHRAKVDTIPGQYEGGLSVAIAPGFKYSWSKYTGSKNAFGLSTKSNSLAGGLLAGLSTVTLDSKATQNKVLDAKATKNLTFPVGVHVVYGYNNLNIGIAIGEDIILGPNRTQWNYFGKVWWGIIVGLDLIK